MNIPKFTMYFKVLIIEIISIFSGDASGGDGDAPFFYFTFISIEHFIYSFYCFFYLFFMMSAEIHAFDFWNETLKCVWILI